MDKVNTFLSPNKIILGNGAVSHVGNEAKKLGAKKALIVTDEGVLKAGLVENIEKSLTSEKVDIGIFDKVKAEPSAGIVDECVKIIQEEKYDIIIGIGGGSSLDVAKGASLAATNKGKILDYAGIDLVPHDGLPKILLPTTAGTGSEVTRALVLTDERENLKKAVYSDFALADVAVVDPLLTLSMPPAVTADTGTKGLEYVSQQDFDLIFLDLKIPGTDGAEILREIRRINPGLPVIIITGYPNSEMMDRATKYGPLGIMLKPFNDSEIINVVNGFLRTVKMRQG